MIQGILSGIRVVDFGRFIAGPFCGALLADHGADVIRIDRIGGSEDRFILPLAPSGDGATFMQVNRGKRSMALDVTSPKGREIVHRLVVRSDIVIANLPQPTLKSMGLDYESISAINRRVILISADGYGRTGPDAHKLAFDGIAQALSGTMYLGGDPGEPRRAIAPYVDFGTAVSCAFGAVLALLARERTGRGQEVTSSLLLTSLTIANSILIEQAVSALDRVPQGNRGYSSAPLDLFRCSDDQWLIVMVLGQPLWRRLCKMLSAQDWVTDPRFQDDRGRGAHASLISERLQAWCATRTRQEALDAFETARIPASPILSPRESLEDAHIRASGMLRDIAFPGMPKPAPIADTPIHLSESPGAIRGRAPLLGEHTDEILKEIGYSTADVHQLRTDGTV